MSAGRGEEETRHHIHMARNDGSSTCGEMDAVLFVGPMAPATKRGFSGFSAVNLSAAALARRALDAFIS